ncbi:DUF4249 domain-containing protein [Pontibacter sp. Tf4]|uniref:DUF4249 domain-containing protein n=1 Tax=Pontibacter sp. Tf4 TaxID=2761620 RepID=UPI00162A8499|nr:DUF4249 domain-containing protein [Pontibacter sp. Tf4]MBB6612243.1 DUF4249 domain-containing protein [Pontibacter sp. Tf4]
MKNLLKPCILLLLLLYSCVDPLDLKIGDEARQLVVDGMITDEPGPYTVRLSRSKPYASYHDRKNAAETGAQVTIADDKGNQETLQEIAPGVYQTNPDGIRGQVGNTYTLSIVTKNSERYTSAPETIVPVPTIDDLYFEVRSQQVLNEEDVEQTVYVANVLLDTKDPAGQKNYYMWKWQGTFKVSTQPWDYSEKVRGVRVPMPKDCCEICWVTAPTDRVNVKDDRLLNGGNLTHYLVTQIPVIPQTFGFKYHIEVKQLSVSEAAFDYWSLLKAQIETGGSIQDPPPAIIIGNITSETNPGQRALGFFGASAVATRTMFIQREELGIPVSPYVMPDDCRVLSKSTTVQPDFW